MRSEIIIFGSKGSSNDASFSFIENDVRRMRLFFGKDKQAHLNFIDPTNEPDKILDDIRKIAASAESSSALVFYYSGHGAIDKKNQLYFVLERSDLQTLPALDILNICLHKTPAKYILCMIDCCYAASPNLDLFQQMLENNISSRIDDDNRCIAIFSASDSRGLAYGDRYGSIMTTELIKIILRFEPKSISDLGHALKQAISRLETQKFIDTYHDPAFSLFAFTGSMNKSADNQNPAIIEVGNHTVNFVYKNQIMAQQNIITSYSAHISESKILLAYGVHNTGVFLCEHTFNQPDAPLPYKQDVPLPMFHGIKLSKDSRFIAIRHQDDQQQQRLKTFKINGLKIGDEVFDMFCNTNDFLFCESRIGQNQIINVLLATTINAQHIMQYQSFDQAMPTNIHGTIPIQDQIQHSRQADITSTKYIGIICGDINGNVQFIQLNLSGIQPSVRLLIHSNINRRFGRVVRVASKSKKILAGYGSGEVLLWSIDDNDRLSEATLLYQRDQQSVTALELSKNAAFFAVGFADGHLYANPITQENQAPSDDINNTITALLFVTHNERTYLISGRKNGAVRVMEMETGVITEMPVFGNMPRQSIMRFVHVHAPQGDVAFGLIIVAANKIEFVQVECI